MPTDLDVAELADEDLELMLLIRHFELNLLDMFGRGELNGTTHTCLGQEYIPVALRPLLGEHDFVFSNHRGHGHYLARFGDPHGLLAEIMGRAGAVCRGVGGSQHILRDGYLSTGVQGESLPVAVGVAAHLAAHGLGVAVVYTGDGTWGEGAVYEALNLAALWRVPLLVVVENNGIAQSTPTATQLAGSIEARVRGFGIAYTRIDTMDVNAIRAELAPAVARVRTARGPLVVEFLTQRAGPHSKGDDTRTEEELRVIRERDWYRRGAHLAPERFVRLDAAARDRVVAVAAEVAARPLAQWEAR